MRQHVAPVQVEMQQHRVTAGRQQVLEIGAGAGRVLEMRPPVLGGAAVGQRCEARARWVAMQPCRDVTEDLHRLERRRAGLERHAGLDALEQRRPFVVARGVTSGAIGLHTRSAFISSRAWI